MSKKNKRAYPIKIGKSSKHTMHDDELSKVNRMRKDLGLKPIEKVERECLKCDAKFTAYLNSANFMCTNCGPRNRGEDSFDF